MKILIVYASVWGVSKTCSEMLASRLGEKFEVTLCDVEDTPPSPEGFDVAVIGGSIRAYKINKKLKKYLKANAAALSQINTALFLCCGLSENFDDYVALQFPTSVIPKLGIHYFGGELKPEKLKGMDKLIVKSMRSSIIGTDFEISNPTVSPLPEIIPENISRLADHICMLS